MLQNLRRSGSACVVSIAVLATLFGVWCVFDRGRVISYARAADIQFNNETRELTVQWEVRRERDCKGRATRRARGGETVEGDVDIRLGQPIGVLYKPAPVKVIIPYNIHGIVQYETDSRYQCRMYIDFMGYRYFLFINPLHYIRPLRFLFPPIRMIIPQHPAVAKRRQEIEWQRFQGEQQPTERPPSAPMQMVPVPAPRPR